MKYLLNVVFYIIDLQTPYTTNNNINVITKSIFFIVGSHRK